MLNEFVIYVRGASSQRITNDSGSIFGTWVQLPAIALLSYEQTYQSTSEVTYKAEDIFCKNMQCLIKINSCILKENEGDKTLYLII